jgi:LPS-assembly lipoprotein
MWSFDRFFRGVTNLAWARAFFLRAPRASKTGRWAVGGVLMLSLGGCIHPLYGKNGVSARLAQIEVAPIPDRIGHYLAEELKFQTDGSGTPQPPKYRLNVTVTESILGLIVNLHSSTSDAAGVTLTATYTLTDIATGNSVTAGTVTAYSSYDRSEQRFANVRAARDAEIRAANVAADQIRTRIGIALLDQK